MSKAIPTKPLFEVHIEKFDYASDGCPDPTGDSWTWDANADEPWEALEIIAAELRDEHTA